MTVDPKTHVPVCAQVTIDEVLDMFYAMGQAMPDAAVEELFFQLDLNKDGTIDFQEFVTSRVRATDTSSLRRDDLSDDAAASKGSAMEELMRMREEFNKFDLDGSGSITRDEIVEVMHRSGFWDITDDDAASFIEDIDPNGNGSIEFMEFVRSARELKRKQAAQQA